MGRVAQTLGVDVYGLSPLETAAAAMETVRQLKADVGVVAGLKELGMQEDEIPSSLHRNHPGSARSFLLPKLA